MTIISHYDKSSSSIFIISDHWQTNCLWSLNSSMAQSLGLILLLILWMSIILITQPFLSPHKTKCGQLDQVFLLIDGIRNNIYRWRSVATEQVMSSATVVLQFLIFYLETLSHMKGCLLSAVSATIQHSTSHSQLLFTIYWPGPGPGVAWAAPLAPGTATQRTGHLLTHSPPRRPLLPPFI